MRSSGSSGLRLHVALSVPCAKGEDDQRQANYYGENAYERRQGGHVGARQGGKDDAQEH